MLAFFFCHFSCKLFQNYFVSILKANEIFNSLLKISLTPIAPWSLKLSNVLSFTMEYWHFVLLDIALRWLLHSFFLLVIFFPLKCRSEEFVIYLFSCFMNILYNMTNKGQLNPKARENATNFFPIKFKPDEDIL